MTLKRMLLAWLLGLLSLWAVTLLATATAQAGSLPPRPTPRPSPTPILTPVVAAKQSEYGAAIELSVAAAQPGWWTVVQWQDARQGWHTVVGWQGSFDTLRRGEGRKTWWVDVGDLGKGPFRWAIFNALGGALLAASDGFNLPLKPKTKTVTQLTVK